MADTNTSDVTPTMAPAVVPTLQNARCKPSDSRKTGFDEFYWTASDEPHATRRVEILKRHPEIAQLFGHDTQEAVSIAAIVFLQFAVGYLVRDAPWWVVLLLSWVVSGTCNHNLELANHELSHNLVFEKCGMNVAFGIFSNLPTGFPSAITFKRYHMEHHSYQGIDGIDVDLPTSFEGRFFRSTFRKFIFLCLQPVFYGVRPTIVRPKPLTNMELVNLAVQMTFNILVYTMVGGKTLFYFIGGTLLGLSLHPMAGHFISEHYMFTPGQETYSYYGPLNILGYNVGYHNEHHDFPRVPGSRLPLVRKLAPEYYDSLVECKSWPGTLYNFVMDPKITPFARVRRSTSQPVTGDTEKTD